MNTDFDFPNKYLIGPVVFRPDFNAQSEVISENQAWSLFFTAGQEDTAVFPRMRYSAKPGNPSKSSIRQVKLYSVAVKLFCWDFYLF